MLLLCLSTVVWSLVLTSEHLLVPFDSIELYWREVLWNDLFALLGKYRDGVSMTYCVNCAGAIRLSNIWTLSRCPKVWRVQNCHLACVVCLSPNLRYLLSFLTARGTRSRIRVWLNCLPPSLLSLHIGSLATIIFNWQLSAVDFTSPTFLLSSWLFRWTWIDHLSAMFCWGLRSGTIECLLCMRARYQESICTSWLSRQWN